MFIEPPQVTQHTKKCQQESDVMLEFINENIETTDDEIDRLKVADVYNAFKYWYRQNYSDNRCPSKSEMKTHIINAVRPMEKNIWIGLKLTTDEGSSCTSTSGFNGSMGGFNGSSTSGFNGSPNMFVNKQKNNVTKALDKL
jgi:hypothetical protein